jgi:SAM-dependent methyltransferase
VLDPGSGAGEHTIVLTRLGYDVLGLDLSPSAIAYARRNADAKGVPAARFQQADVTRIGDDPEYAAGFGVFDTIVDSALFHVFREDPQARAAYVRSLHTLCRPGGVLHVLALSDAEPGFGPRISDTLIRESFTEGWELQSLEPARYRGRVVAGVLSEEEIARLGAAPGGIVAGAAWLARMRRI